MDKKKTTLELTGEKFGKINVISFSRYFGNFTYWNCICECGEKLEINYRDLLSEKILCCENCNSPEKSALDAVNSIAYSNTTTGIRGIYLDKKTNFWKASISYKGISYFLGLNENIEDSIRARINGERIIDKLKSKEPAKISSAKKPTIDLVGKKFGKLTVASFSHFKNDYAYWRCKCECGNEKTIYQQNLISKATISCGCVKSQNGKKYHDENFTFYEGVMIEKAAAKVTPKNNTSGFRGVNYVKKTDKWRAVLRFKGERYELGHYHDFEEAKQARILAEEMIDDFLDNYYNTLELNVKTEAFN